MCGTGRQSSQTYPPKEIRHTRRGFSRRHRLPRNFRPLVGGSQPPLVCPIHPLGVPATLPERSVPDTGGGWRPDLPGHPPPAAHRPCPFGRLALPTASPHSLPLSRVQDYLPGCPSPTLALFFRHQPRLRSRLTLGRLPLPRNPQAFGVAGSHRQSALLIQAFALRFAPRVLPPPLLRYSRTLPYHRHPPAYGRRLSAASVPRFSPVTLSARRHSTSELLRTLSRMAASKPTSWLSAQPHNLSHSAWIWGP